MATKFAKRLAKMNKAWQESDAAGGGGGNVNPLVEVGKQEAVLRKAVLVEAGDDLAIQFVWEFDVDAKALKKAKKADKNASNQVVCNSRITEDRMPYLKKDFAELFPDYDVDEIDFGKDLEQLLAELTTNQPRCKVFVKLSDDEAWMNVYLNKLEENTGEGDGEDDDDDDDADEADDDSDDDEDEDDEEKKPRGKKPGKKPKPGKKSSKKDEDDDEDDDDSDDSDDDDDDSDDDDDEAEIEKGSTVLYQPKGKKKQLKFTVVKIDAKKGTAILKDEDGEKLDKPVKLDLLELAADEDDDADDDDEEEYGKVEEGAKVEALISGNTYTGTVQSVDAKSETCKVKITAKGKLKGQVKKVAIEDIEILE